MKFIDKLKNRLTWMGIYNSPFKRPKIRIYIGRTAVGTPYFLPRKWVPNPEKEGYLMAVKRRVGFDVVDLGWKTKWDDTDIRFEWNPIWSFVFFGFQIALSFYSPHNDQYWESYLFYKHITDSKKSMADRVKQCREEFDQKWVTTIDGERIETDYYNLILKKKFL